VRYGVGRRQMPSEGERAAVLGVGYTLSRPELRHETGLAFATLRGCLVQRISSSG
jgi:hypothetical protein